MYKGFKASTSLYNLENKTFGNRTTATGHQSHF